LYKWHAVVVVAKLVHKDPLEKLVKLVLRDPLEKLAHKDPLEKLVKLAHKDPPASKTTHCSMH
jgi:hypothetical protein